MTAEPFDLAAYLRLRGAVESYLRFDGGLKGMPEAAQRAYLKAQTRRLWDGLRAARRQDPSI